MPCRGAASRLTPTKLYSVVIPTGVLREGCKSAPPYLSYTTASLTPTARCKAQILHHAVTYYKLDKRPSVLALMQQLMPLMLPGHHHWGNGTTARNPGNWGWNNHAIQGTIGMSLSNLRPGATSGSPCGLAFYFLALASCQGKGWSIKRRKKATTQPSTIQKSFTIILE